MYKTIVSVLLVSIFCFISCNPEDSTAQEEQGKMIFRKNCKLCHGIDGKLQANGSKDLTLSKLSLEERILTIKNGRNTMTAFGKVLSPTEIEAVANYTQTLK